VNITTEIEDLFRPATNEIDLIALKSVMGADFRDELVNEIEVDLSAQSLRRNSLFLSGLNNAFKKPSAEENFAAGQDSSSSNDTPG
jgi:hypothetical protein